MNASCKEKISYNIFLGHTKNGEQIGPTLVVNSTHRQKVDLNLLLGNFTMNKMQKLIFLGQSYCWTHFLTVSSSPSVGASLSLSSPSSVKSAITEKTRSNILLWNLSHLVAGGPSTSSVQEEIIRIQFWYSLA